MAITPPIMTYPLGTDYYDVEVFNTNWENLLTYLDNNFLNNERVLSEQLSTSNTNVLSTEASNKLFENGVGADVMGYIEDGGTHTAGTVWLSKFNKGEFKCLTTNTDDFIDTNKWFQIDDLSTYNANTYIFEQSFTIGNSGRIFFRRFGNLVRVEHQANYKGFTSHDASFTLPPQLIPQYDSGKNIVNNTNYSTTNQPPTIVLTIKTDGKVNVGTSAVTISHSVPYYGSFVYFIK